MSRRGPYICGIDAAMDVISGKWKSLILWELHHHGTRRFGELRRGLPGVSEKMLVQHLRELEEDGLIDREVFREVPPRVEYSLTEDGRSLNHALGPLGDWGSRRRERLAAESASPTPEQPTPKQAATEQPTPVQAATEQPTPNQPTPEQAVTEQPAPEQPEPKRAATKKPVPEKEA
jgi:DNA-binding HxlR family transcriptional regulator